MTIPPAADNLQKLVVPTLVAVILGLIGVLWTIINGQMADVRADIRVVQSEVSSQNGNLRELTQRLTDLINTLNAGQKNK
jgi:nitrogen fixation-related uncharacterized protein